jgi:hypothetical protein
MQRLFYRIVDRYWAIVFWIVLAGMLWALGVSMSYGQELAPPAPRLTPPASPALAGSERPPLDEADVAAIVQRVVDQAVERALAGRGASVSMPLPSSQGYTLASPQSVARGTTSAVSVLVPRGPVRRWLGRVGSSVYEVGRPRVATYELAPALPLSDRGPSTRGNLDFSLGLGWER